MNFKWDFRQDKIRTAYQFGLVNLSRILEDE